MRTTIGATHLMAASWSRRAALSMVCALTMLLGLPALAHADASFDISTTDVSGHSYYIGVDEHIHVVTAITNNGPSASAVSSVETTIPAGVTVDTATINPIRGGDSCAIGASVTCTVASLAMGEAVNIDLELHVTVAGPYAITTAVTPDVSDTSAFNQTSTNTFYADLLVDASPLASTISPTVVGDGRTSTVHLVQSNEEVSTLTTSSITASLEFGEPIPAWTAITYDRPGTDTCSLIAGEIDCSFGAITGNSSAGVTITFAAPLTAVGTYSTLYVSSSTGMFESNSGNNFFTMSQQVVPWEIDLAPSLSAPQTAVAGHDYDLSGSMPVSGALPATGLALDFTAPASTTPVAGSFTVDGGPITACSVSGQHITCAIGDHPAGASVLYSFTVHADTVTHRAAATVKVATTAPPLVNTADDIATAYTNIVPERADLSISGGTGIDVGVAGATSLEYLVTNSGPSPTTAVVASVALPDNVSPTSATFDLDGAGASPCSVSGQIVTCAIGAMDVSSQATIAVAITGGAVEGSDLAVATASAAASPPDTSLGDHMWLTPIVVISAAEYDRRHNITNNLHIDASLGATTYLLSYTGDDIAPDAQFVLQLPPGVSMASYTSLPAGPVCTQSGGSGGIVTCDLGDIDPAVYAPSYWQLGLQITTTTIGEGHAQFLASASVGIPESNYDDNFVVTNRSALPTGFTVASTDLAIELHAPFGDWGTTGQSVTYAGTVSNLGPMDSEATVTVVLPPGVLRLYSFIDGGSCSYVAPVVTCTVPGMLDGMVANLTIVVGFQSPGVRTLVASVAGNENESDPGNNVATVTTQVYPAQVSDAVANASAVSNIDEDTTTTFSFTGGLNGPVNDVPFTSVITLPAGSTVGTITPSGGYVCNLVGRVLTCTAATGGVESVAVELTFPDPGTFAATAVTTSALVDPAPTNNTSTATIDVAQVGAPLGASMDVDLAAGISGLPARVRTGEVVPLTVGVTQYGLGLVEDTTATIPMPAGAQIVAGASTCVTNGAGTLITCEIGTGGAAALALKFTQTGVRSLVATVHGTNQTGGVDPNSANDVVTKSVEVTAGAPVDVRVDATALPSGSPITAGATRNEATWMFDVMSLAGDAHGVELDVTLPAGATVVDVASSASTNACAPPSGGHVTCAIGTLLDVSAHLGGHVRVAVHVQLPGPGVYAASGTVVTSDQDDEASNNEASQSVTLRDPVDVDYGVALATDAVAGTSTQVVLVAELTNHGPASGSAVGTITLPAAATVRALRWSPADVGTCTQSGVTITCATDGTMRVTVVLGTPATAQHLAYAANMSGLFADSNSGNNSATAGTDVLVASDADLVVTMDPIADGVVGELATINLHTGNGGPGVATGVTTSIVLPAGVALTGATGAVCGQVGVTVTCTSGTLLWGERRDIALTLEPSGVVNAAVSAAVDGAETDSVSGNNAASRGFVVTAAPVGADLGLTISDVADPVAMAGDAVTYRAVVHNAGPAAARGVHVEFNLPAAGASYAAALPTQGSCVRAALVVTCELGGVAAGRDATVRLLLVATAVGSVSVGGDVSHVGNDPVGGNDTDSESTTITTPGTADVAVTAGAGAAVPATVAGGGTVVVTAHVANNGPLAATGVTLAATLPAGASLVSGVIGAGAGSCSAAVAGVSTCSIGALAAGAGVDVVFTLAPTRFGAQSIAFAGHTTAADGNAANDGVAVPFTLRDGVAPTVTMSAVKCARKGALRRCVASGGSADATGGSGVASVEVNAWRAVAGGCMGWTGTSWKKSSCAVAKARWVRVATRGGAWKATFAKSAARKSFTVSARATDASGNRSAVAKRVARP